MSHSFWSILNDPMSSRPKSPLLALPAEIRECIFEFALTSDKPLVTFRLDDFQRECYQEAVQPPLLNVNRQIRSEALPIYYGCNEFIFHTEGKKADDAHHWLRHAQPHLDKMGKATFWLRYLTRTHQHVGPVGALGIAMEYVPRKERWVVSPAWRWITVVRKPVDVEPDGEFLVDSLQAFVCSENREISAEFYGDLMSNLRKSYIAHKVA